MTAKNQAVKASGKRILPPERVQNNKRTSEEVLLLFKGAGQTEARPVGLPSYRNQFDSVTIFGRLNKKRVPHPGTRLSFKAPIRIELMNKGFADLCLTAWLWRHNRNRTRDIRVRLWSGLRGSNPPPPPWQGGALPNELNPHSGLMPLVPPVGIEPTTRGFSVLCSTN